MSAADVEARQAVVLDLYRIAIEEYRFEVRLGWERTSHLLTLDAGLFAASVGLVQLGHGAPGWLPAALIAVVSAVGVAVSLLGISTLRASRAYYERTKAKKAFFESRLGLLHPHPGQTSALSNLAVTTTGGMADVVAILANPESWLRGQRFRWLRRAITSYTAWLFVLLGTVHAAAGLAALWFTPDEAR